MSTSTAIFDRFATCTVEVLAVEPAQVVPEAEFGPDLGADSLDLVELVMRLEEEFDVTIEEEELKDIRTVGQALELVNSKI